MRRCNAELSDVSGCELNDLSAPLPHQLQIRRMMKRQVLECGIQVLFWFSVCAQPRQSVFFSFTFLLLQDISKDAAKFVSDALDIYLQVSFMLKYRFFLLLVTQFAFRNSFKG